MPSPANPQFILFLSKPEVRWGSMSTVMREQQERKENQMRFYSSPIKSFRQQIYYRNQYIQMENLPWAVVFIFSFRRIFLFLRGVVFPLPWVSCH